MKLTQLLLAATLAMGGAAVVGGCDDQYDNVDLSTPTNPNAGRADTDTDTAQPAADRADQASPDGGNVPTTQPVYSPPAPQ